MENEPMNNDKLSFIIAAYERCFDSKHHYDNLSWAIGGILLVFVGASLAYLPQIKGKYYFWTVIYRIIIAIFSWILLCLWYKIYERNRFWAEVANEKIRDFEREFETEGVGILFMKANKDGHIILKNRDEKGNIIDKERKELLIKNSMHKVIPWFLLVIGIVIFGACFIPIR